MRFPFVGAGMGFVALPSLVAAVSNAGGIGVLGNAVEPAPSTPALIQVIKTMTTKPFGVDFIFDESAFGPLVTDAHIDVWVGTRLVASTESYAHDEYKHRITVASGNSTVTTTMFGPEYPNRPYRVLRNRVTKQFAGHEDQIPSPETVGDFDEMGMAAGDSVTLIKDIKPAEQIVIDIMTEAQHLIKGDSGDKQQA
ncbi:MAG TPA: nitronate monooxygenase [Gemmatimonadaceae bacterium]|nr:nitronate monooxygenase [Gemmatimonadaceae bacterium]